MATLYAINPLNGVVWSDRSPVYQPPGGGIVAVAMGNTFSPVAAADVVRFCKVPPGAVVVGGTIAGLGLAGLDVNFGWEANGVEEADPDAFGHIGGSPLILMQTYPKFSRETWLSGVVGADANADGLGQLSVIVQFVVS